MKAAAQRAPDREEARPEPPSGSSRRRDAVGVAIPLAAYALLAVALYLNVWVDPSRAWIGDSKDPRLFIWYLGWVPAQLSHWQSPLYTTHLNYPAGVNLMWNTSILFPALLLWPITASWGPVVAYNVLVTAGVALTAWLGFLAARRFVDNLLLSALVGLLYGFSPGIVAQATRHPHAMIALFPAVALIFGDEILVRQRRHPVLIGILAGLAGVLQLLTGEEILATTALIAGLGVILVALLKPHEVATRLPYLWKAATAAAASFALLAAYPMFVQFGGPQRVSGPAQPPDRYVTDLLALVTPNFALLRTGLTDQLARTFTGNVSENNAYFGLPLLALFGWGLKVNWQRPSIRWAGLLTLAIAILSLGPELHVAGLRTGIPLPWALVGGLPLMETALPSRLMLAAYLGAGIVVALLWMRLGEGRRWPRFVFGALGLAAIVTLAPAIPLPSTPSGAPAFFQPGGASQQIPAGSVALVTPFSSNRSTDAMYWQALAHYRFRMPEGDAFTPGPYLGPHPSYLEAVLEQLDAGVEMTPSPGDRIRALQDLSELRIATVVAGPSPGQDLIVRYLTAVLGRPPVESGGVEVWWNLAVNPG